MARHRFAVFGLVLGVLGTLGLLAATAPGRRFVAGPRRVAPVPGGGEVLGDGLVWAGYADALSASITHEIYQPLGAILANVDAGALLWKQEPLPAAELRAILDEVRFDVLHIKQVVEKLRPLMARRWVDPVRLQPNDVVNASRHLLAHLARRHRAALQIELAPRLRPIMGDSTHLQQMLINLATNGLEAMQGLPPSRRALRVATEAGEDGSVVFSLADSGPGIPPQALQDVFTAFHTTKPEGMGMGLAIVKTIVDAHGGRIEIARAPAPGGAVVRVSLPTVDAGRPFTAA